MENINPWKGNPEQHVAKIQASGAKPFEIMTNSVPESVITKLMEDKKLMTALMVAGWPTNEDTCEVIGKKHGLGAEQVAAISKYQRGADAGEE